MPAAEIQVLAARARSSGPITTTWYENGMSRGRQELTYNYDDGLVLKLNPSGMENSGNSQTVVFEDHNLDGLADVGRMETITRYDTERKSGQSYEMQVLGINNLSPQWFAFENGLLADKNLECWMEKNPGLYQKSLQTDRQYQLMFTAALENF